MHAGNRSWKTGWGGRIREIRESVVSRGPCVCFRPQYKRRVLSHEPPIYRPCPGKGQNPAFREELILDYSSGASGIRPSPPQLEAAWPFGCYQGHYYSA